MKIYTLLFVSYDYFKFVDFVKASLDKAKLIDHINTRLKKYPYYEDPDSEKQKELKEKEEEHWEIITTVN